MRVMEARRRLARALAGDSPPDAAVILLDRDGEIQLSSPAAARWLAEHFGAADHPGWLPRPVAEWLALPPRPPLVSDRDGRRLIVQLLPGDPHVLLVEETVASFRVDVLGRLGLTGRETEVLCAAATIEDEVELAWELFLSLHAVRERLASLEAKLGVRTVGDAVARGAPRERLIWPSVCQAAAVDRGRVAAGVGWSVGAAPGACSRRVAFSLIFGRARPGQGAGAQGAGFVAGVRGLETSVALWGCS